MTSSPPISAAAVVAAVQPAAIDFSRMFHARSIAVIGASTTTTKPSGQPLLHLKNMGFDGQVFPVNPRYERVLDWLCYPDVASLPQVPDVALIAVAADQVVHHLTACGRKGITHVILITSGFSEMGASGEAAQAELVAVAREYGITLIGPNCQGMISVGKGFSLGFGAPYGFTYLKGPISMTSQSGAWGNTVMMLANAQGLGFQNYQSTGNEAATTSLDLVDWYLDDPHTGMVVSYVEGFKDAHRVVEIGRKALAVGKPYLLWKVGSSEAGARAAASHTANLGGAMALYRAAFRQSGIIEVADVNELADRARALLAPRKPKGNRVAVVTLSGGAGVLMADHCAPAGLDLPELSASTLARLKEILPPYAGLNNPIDLTGNIAAKQENMIESLRLVVNDPKVDMMGVCLAAVSGPVGIQLAQWVAEVARTTDKPILVAWVANEATTQEGYDALAEAQVPRYDTPVRCVLGMDALWRFAKAQKDCARIATEPVLRIHRPERQQMMATQKTDLPEYQAKQVLADYGIAVTPEALATSADDAVVQARKLGFPVALKIMSADIPHKTEAGGVRIGLADAAAVRLAYTDILANTRHYAPHATLEGVLVQAMVSGGVEVIVGVNNDPLFGPAIMFGLGGIFAEVLKDVSFRILPITRSEAMDMVREIKAFPILDGARGRPKADVDALVDTLVKLAALALDLKDQVAEIDINPLFVLPEGQGVVAADALIKPRLVNLRANKL